MKPLPELERRRVATEKTLAKYRDTAFDWAAGRTCIHLAKFQARAMGHRLPSVPRFRSALGAKKALAAMGAENVIGLLDTLLPRIAPAEMLLGDLAAVAGEGGLDAVMVCAGPMKLLGWREDADAMVVLDVPLGEVSAAWRL